MGWALILSILTAFVWHKMLAETRKGIYFTIVSNGVFRNHRYRNVTMFKVNHITRIQTNHREFERWAAVCLSLWLVLLLRLCFLGRRRNYGAFAGAASSKCCSMYCLKDLNSSLESFVVDGRLPIRFWFIITSCFSAGLLVSAMGRTRKNNLSL